MTLRMPRLAAWAAACVLMTAPPVVAGPQDKPAADPGNLKGKLLVAAPTLEDPNFTKTVVFILEHDEHGALGIVVNRVLGTAPASEILKGLGVDGSSALGQLRLFLGGPVQPQVAFVVHSPDFSDSDTHNIADGLSVTSDSAILEAISKGKGPTKTLIAIGYSGWGPGQLEAEIAHDAWYVAPADTDIVFGDDIDSKWKRALAMSGTDL